MNIKSFLSGYRWLPFISGTFILHLLGTMFLMVAGHQYPMMIGLGFVAYTLGLRHAFDADHIAAIDNTVRKLIQQKSNPAGVGFFFSLGHSTVVFLMAVVLGLSVQWAQKHMPLFKQVGGMVGSIVSGVFLIFIALFNLMILLDLQRMFFELRRRGFDRAKFEELLLSRGFLSKLFKPLLKFINKSWHVYPLGFLFGLGFDTATEVALLALSAGASRNAVSFFGILALPLLFAAGMNLMDTLDSIMMSKAYKWAFDTPVRKIYYNLTITAISVLAAFFIGGTELIQIIAGALDLKGGFWDWIQGLTFNWLGCGLIVIFLGLWMISYAIWKIFGIEKKWDQYGA